MTAPLYDVKARFSEYVTMAEEGEVVEITKHGNATTVLISIKIFNELNENESIKRQPSFMERVKKWREETGGLSQEEAEDFCNLIEKLKHEEDAISSNREENPWD